MAGRPCSSLPLEVTTTDYMDLCGKTTWYSPSLLRFCWRAPSCRCYELPVCVRNLSAVDSILGLQICPIDTCRNGLEFDQCFGRSEVCDTSDSDSRSCFTTSWMSLFHCHCGVVTVLYPLCLDYLFTIRLCELQLDANILSPRRVFNVKPASQPLAKLIVTAADLSYASLKPC